MNTSNVPSTVLAERLEKLQRKSWDARIRGATVDQLASIAQEIEQTRGELFQKRAEEQKERIAAANQRMLASRTDVEREHVQWQQGRGAPASSFTPGGKQR